MEVLLVVAAAGFELPLDAVRHALHTSSPEPLELLESLPESPQQLGCNQLVVMTTRINAASLASVFTSESCSQSTTDKHDSTLLLKKVAKRERKIKALTIEVATLRQRLETVTQRVTHLEIEQAQFFEDVQDMKTRFDKLSQHHQKVLWEYLPAHDAAMAAIPLIDKQIHESATRIGAYPLRDVIGSGQYATVYASSSTSPDAPALAIKVIDKAKLLDVVALVRLSSELATLRDQQLAHPSLLAAIDVIHTQQFVYVVTARGGNDLFDYFGSMCNHGLDEDVVRLLMRQVAQAVQVLHRNNYCHRDLKPENILYRPERSATSAAAAATPVVTLIDFGLCTKLTTTGNDSDDNPMLDDFCGSPGFFAPEILLSERYDGTKADVWSLGCILLELVVGNTTFVALWMAMYELDVLQDRTRFAASVQQGLTQVRAHCASAEWHHSPLLRQLLLALLCETPRDRLSIDGMLAHAWFHAGATAASDTGTSHCNRPAVKAHSTPSVSSVAPLRVTRVVRPLSAELAPIPPGGRSAAGDHHAQLQSPRARASVVSVKVRLPSLSPDKPAVAASRSPDRVDSKCSIALAVHGSSE